ncbi:MAG: hypothetical protein HY551_01980 [Elusimicrobia bacterium]|nr:hypothetical protein [Elusimicrobiota bacterium]
MPSFGRENFNIPLRAVGFAAAGLCVISLLNLAVFQRFHTPFPNPSQLRPSTAEATQSTGLMALGMRRLAADLAFIQLLMYYGTPEADEGAGRAESKAEHQHEEYGGGHYSELGPRAQRIMKLDPTFAYVPLYAAGALAFNLGRAQEALDILSTAARADPREWKFRAYMAAIGAQKRGDAPAVLRELGQALDDPDCPTLIKHIAAFLNRSLGRREEAIRLYREILSSRDPSYYETARRALRELGAAIQ